MLLVVFFSFDEGSGRDTKLLDEGFGGFVLVAVEVSNGGDKV
jgi:hypothetical protein